MGAMNGKEKKRKEKKRKGRKMEEGTRTHRPVII